MAQLKLSELMLLLSLKINNYEKGFAHVNTDVFCNQFKKSAGKTS